MLVDIYRGSIVRGQEKKLAENGINQRRANKIETPAMTST